jgi:hypothetical protein
MKPLKLIAIGALIGMGISYAPSPAVAAPNCPPQYQEICKQLIQALNDTDSALGDFQWDGTHLIVGGDIMLGNGVGGNFAFYSTINHDLVDHKNGYFQASSKETMFGADYFPHLLNQVAAASQGGQRVYLHLFQGFNTYKDVGLSNTPILAPPTPIVIPQVLPQPVLQSQSPSAPNKAPDQMVFSAPPQVTTGYNPYNVPAPAQQLTPTPLPVPPQMSNKAPPPIPNKVPQVAPQLQPVKSASQNQPKSVSVTHSLKSHSGQQVDHLNVNHHFVTKSAGSLIESEERAYLFDSNDHVWSCKISGLGARRMPSGDGNHQIQGHVETLQFRSVHLAHIPGNHPMHSACLISVQQ